MENLRPYIRELNYQQGTVGSVTFNWQIEERPLWNLLQRSSPDLALRWVDRLAPDESVAVEWVFAQTLESMLQISVPERGQWLRALYGEMQSLLWAARYAARLLGALGDRHHQQMYQLICEELMNYQDFAFGSRVLPQIICLGGVRRDVTLGGKVRAEKALGFVEAQWQQCHKELSADDAFVSRLVESPQLTRSLVEQIYICGPFAESAGVKAWFENEYFPPSELLAFLPDDSGNQTTGHALARWQAMERGVQRAISRARHWLQTLPSGEFVSPFAAGDQLPKGECRKRIMAPSGEISCWLRHGKVLFSTSSMRSVPLLPTLCQGLPLEDLEWYIASLGFDPAQGALA